MSGGPTTGSQGRDVLLRGEAALMQKQRNAEEEIARVAARFDEAVADMPERDRGLVRVAIECHPGELVTKPELRQARHALTLARMQLDSKDARRVRKATKPGRAAERAEMTELGRKILWLLDNWRMLGGGERHALNLLPITQERFDHWHGWSGPLTDSDKRCWFGHCAVALGIPANRIERVYSDARGEA